MITEILDKEGVDFPFHVLPHSKPIWKSDDGKELMSRIIDRFGPSHLVPEYIPTLLITARQQVLNTHREMSDIECDTNIPELIREYLLVAENN